MQDNNEKPWLEVVELDKDVYYPKVDYMLISEKEGKGLIKSLSSVSYSGSPLHDIASYLKSDSQEGIEKAILAGIATMVAFKKHSEEPLRFSRQYSAYEETIETTFEKLEGNYSSKDLKYLKTIFNNAKEIEQAPLREAYQIP